MNRIQARFYLLIGHVQGVGFRPFVYRLAMENNIFGWVENWAGQVAIHAEGNADKLRVFEDALIDRAPPHASPIIRESRETQCAHHNTFSIRASDARASTDIRIIADLPICKACLEELFDKNDRRYNYPFINCTHCGPRYTLIRQLPYDRANTTMRTFPLCARCQREYEDPLDRRFHAEPIACADCGPNLLYKDNSSEITDNKKALVCCVHALQQGKIVAVKGIGGYHLMCDARDDEVVLHLRERKHRPDKPLAVMLPDTQLNKIAATTNEQRELLNGVVHPIILLNKLLLTQLSTQRRTNNLSEHIAPGLNEIGVILPYSPLHHLLLRAFDAPLVATSANISGEPVLIDNQEVEQRLHSVADAWLHHNRPIQRSADDPVYRFIHNKARPLRLGRGNTPLELTLPFRLESPVLAVGGHMKNTIALAWDARIVVSPYIGELDSLRSQHVFNQVISDLQKLYEVNVQQVVCDAHPGYASNRWAYQTGLTVHPVFHHHAHASCVAGEFSHEEVWLVFTWDGTGLGADQTLWGGEALFGQSGHWEHVASMRPFYLPGGEQAGRTPWRSAAALCWEVGVPWQLSGYDTELVHHAWQHKVNCPQSSAVGRLFDAAASLTGLIHATRFEGQGPMLLEASARNGIAETISLPLNCDEKGIWRTDWVPLIALLMNDPVPLADRARCFHESMAGALLQQALQIRETHGDFAVGLSGGVFQNRLLTERAIVLLEQHGFRCYLPQQIPVNDAGLCFGQIMELNGLLQD
ncbi:MAG: carbamoyltransferase HypF [Gammaproteobacteria bacterium]|nr:carbamoyltransferase HypF [Gammaproteobacteria bacterium]